MVALKYYMAAFTVIAGMSLSGVKSMAFPTGIVNNNPGNIERNDILWEGMQRLQPHGRFIRFETPECGIRALVKVLISYRDKHGLDTVNGIINRYAPATENNTYSYVVDVSKRSGFYPNEIVDLHDVDTLIKLAKAITIHENGLAPEYMPFYWYDEAIYHRAALDALEDKEC